MHGANSNINAKEKGLIKGALRRVFSRSEAHKAAVAKTIVASEEVPVELRAERNRVKTWCRCPSCGTFTAKSYMQVDHIEPVVPIESSLDAMSIQEIADRIWCSVDNLSAICKPCHKAKTKAENAARRAAKKARQGVDASLPNSNTRTRKRT